MDNENQSYLAIYGPQLIDQGYHIVPIKPGLKHPGMAGWQDLAVTPDTLTRYLSNGYAAGGVGILTRYNPAVDLDILDVHVADRMHDLIVGTLGNTPTRVGRAPKQALIFRTDEPFTKVTSRTFVDLYGDEHRVEVLGDGQQVVAYAVHPDTNQPYAWTGDGLAGIPSSALPPITLADARGIVGAFEAMAVEQGWEPKPKSKGEAGNRLDQFDDADEAFLANSTPTQGWSTDDAWSRLKWIPADDRDTWIRVGMGLYHEFRGSAEAFELWDEWSKTAHNYGGTDWSRWEGFAADLTRGAPVTARSITSMAREHRQAAKATERAERAASDGFDVFWWGDTNSSEAPPRQLIEEFLAYGQASLVAAQPNTGKSVLSLDQAICVASGSHWRDKEVEQGTVLYIAAESPETIKARILAEKRFRGIEADLPIAVVQNPINLTTEEDREAFCALIAGWMGRHPNTNFIILDTFRNATPGLEENESKAIGPVVGMCHDIAKRHQVHFQIDHHTTKSGEGYAGSGAFGAIVDTEILIVKGEDDMKGLLCIEVKQQRGLNSRGDKYWYEIQGAETGRVTNFGKNETAPVIKKHWLDADLEFRRVEIEETKQAEKEAGVDADLRLVLDAMRAGNTSRADLVTATGLSQPRVRAAQAWGVETGELEARGEGSARRYFTPEKG